MSTKYVMENNAQGKSGVSMREDITNTPEVASRLFARDLWINSETPARIDPYPDPTTPGKIRHEPPEGGAIFRLVDYMPGVTRTIEEQKRMHAQIGSAHVPSDDAFHSLKHPSMHKTDTINYMVLVSGELWALTETEDVLLKPGDVLVQKGCMHGWRNDGTVPARLLAVLIDSQPGRA